MHALGEAAAARAGAPAATSCASRLQLVRERLELGRLAARRVGERLREQPVREPRVARQQRAVQVRPDRAPDAAALEPALAVVAEAVDDAAERQRAVVEVRAAGVVLEARERPRPAQSQSSSTSPIIRRSPATVCSGKSPMPGSSAPSRSR